MGAETFADISKVIKAARIGAVLYFFLVISLLK